MLTMIMNMIKGAFFHLFVKRKKRRFLFSIRSNTPTMNKKEKSILVGIEIGFARKAR